jgi:SAM-dependent methyltransferase
MNADAHYVGSELELFRAATQWKRYVAAQLAPFTHGDVLEVGAGLGGTTTLVHSSGCTSWTCLEPDRGLASQLRATVAPLRDRRGQCPAVEIGTLAALDGSRRFDCVLYLDVLEHIADDREELRQAARFLRPGGQLVVLSPAWSFLYTAFDRAIGHHRRYNRRTLAACGAPETRLVLCRYLDSVGILASLGNRLLMRQAQPTSAQIRFWDGWLVPLSRRVDAALGFRVGKSILAVWQRS